VFVLKQHLIDWIEKSGRYLQKIKIKRDKNELKFLRAQRENRWIGSMYPNKSLNIRI